jgi:hypothetical protein
MQCNTLSRFAEGFHAPKLRLLAQRRGFNTIS